MRSLSCVVLVGCLALLSCASNEDYAASNRLQAERVKVDSTLDSHLSVIRRHIDTTDTYVTEKLAEAIADTIASLMGSYDGSGKSTDKQNEDIATLIRNYTDSNGIPGGTVQELNESIDRLVYLTGIPSHREGTFFGLIYMNDSLSVDFHKWEEWIKINRQSLHWDSALNQIVKDPM